MDQARSAKIVKAAFELYAEGNSRLEDIAEFLREARHYDGATNDGRAKAAAIERDQVDLSFSPTRFTIGLFRYAGEIIRRQTSAPHLEETF